jgi:hypothetical protein
MTCEEGMFPTYGGTIQSVNTNKSTILTAESTSTVSWFCECENGSNVWAELLLGGLMDGLGDAVQLRHGQQNNTPVIIRFSTLFQIIYRLSLVDSPQLSLEQPNSSAITHDTTICITVLILDTIFHFTVQTTILVTVKLFPRNLNPTSLTFFGPHIL